MGNCLRAYSSLSLKSLTLQHFVLFVQKDYRLQESVPAQAGLYSDYGLLPFRHRTGLPLGKLFELNTRCCGSDAETFYVCIVVAACNEA